MRLASNLCCLAAIVMSMAVGCGDNIGTTTTELALVVSAAPSLRTTEAGGTATFIVALRAQPADDVVITVATSDPDEGVVSPMTITLTPENWNVPVTVTVTGVDDDVVDGDTAYEVRVEAAGADRVVVMLTNDDNDDTGISVTPRAGLMTTEAGGSAMFDVVLDTEPTANVVLAITSSDPGEGLPEVTSLTFTPLNWNAPQTVTVTGVDDDLADGAVAYTVAIGPAVSNDPMYEDLDGGTVALTNLDDDSPGIAVAPTAGLQTTEAGGTATFTVVLSSQPTANVTIAVTSSAPDEGVADMSTLTFTPANWDAPVTVTVTGVDDPLDDGDQSYSIVLAPAVSTDAGYAGLDPANVAVTNIDNEAPGFTVTPTSGVLTTETGGTDTFTVALVSAPTAPVTIQVLSNDTSEGIATPGSLTFTAADWDVPRTVTVTGVDDAIADGNQVYRILLQPATSTDPAYNGFDPTDVLAMNIDNDSPGIRVTPTSGLFVSELGDTAQFTIVLNSEPTANVTIPLASSDLGEGTVAPASVTFTTANWNIAQVVTITGVDDATSDGNQVFSIVTAPAQSTDLGYAGLNAANVTVTNVDNDVAAVVVDATPLLVVTEAGGTATFTMRLTTEPLADVTCTLASTHPTEGTVNPTSVVFTPANFSTAQVVTITGVDDLVDDGDQVFLIVTNSCQSADPAYNNFNPRDVSARNLDND
ncbi:MAG: hypothetical protein M3680_10580 [Myxococcota bacterium]|nr:hypothetical protein [Myxococcota bacterium]